MYNKLMVNISKILIQTEKGVVFNVKLVPNSSFSKIADYTEDYVRIKISAPAIENKANKELIAFCSALLNVNKSKLEIVSGEKSKLKKVLIKDTKLDELSQKLLFVLNSENKND